MKRSVVLAAAAVMTLVGSVRGGQFEGEGDVRSTDVFYNALRPYGRWMPTEEFGAVWQPEEARCSPGWRPYCDGGRWVQTPRGPSWCSTYVWGWAPFHYGRWILHGRWGWIWVPGVRWAPAWVLWRDCPGYVAWAPLPPPPPPQMEMRFGLHGGSGGCEWSFEISERDYVSAPADGMAQVSFGIVTAPPCDGGGHHRGHGRNDFGGCPPRPGPAPRCEAPAPPPGGHGSGGRRGEESVRIVRQRAGAPTTAAAAPPSRGSAPTTASAPAPSGGTSNSRAERGRQIVRAQFRH
jgi:hypothetical protein